jgi:hypothetical protein
MDIRWSSEKNNEIKNLRGVSFEQLLKSRFIGIEKNKRKPHQRLILFEYKKYVWVVPYVQGEGRYFLKTAFPSRKHTKKYLGGIDDD